MISKLQLHWNSPIYFLHFFQDDAGDPGVRLARGRLRLGGGSGGGAGEVEGGEGNREGG